MHVNKKDSLTLPSTPYSRTKKLFTPQGNIECWFQSLLRCREKRKIEIRITTNFIYIIYSLITFSVGSERSGVDVSDGLVMYEILNAINPDIIKPLAPCNSNIDKVCNLKKYSEVCLYPLL